MKEIIELLEIEINQFGTNWNLFGKVDKMKYLLEKLKQQLKNK